MFGSNILRPAAMATLILAGALAPALTGAQIPPSPPASRAATIVMPPRLLPAEQSTLAVLDPEGRLVPGAVVEFGDGEHVTTDTTGRAIFVAPLNPGVLTAHLTNREAATASSTILPREPLPTEGLQVTDFPRVISVSDRFSIDGFGFSGHADKNRVALGDTNVVVLAASPVALVLLPAPGATPGPAQLQIEAGGRSAAPMLVTVVSLRVIGPSSQPAQGQKAVLTVRVRGTTQRLAIEVHNLSPAIIELSRGNVQRVTSSGGAQNEAQVEMTGLAAGDFSVSVRLVPGIAGLPDMEAVHQQLLVARRMANADWQERLDRVIRRIERDPEDVSRVRDELERMLAQNPEAELGKQIEAARQILLKR